MYIITINCNIKRLVLFFYKYRMCNYTGGNNEKEEKNLYILAGSTSTTEKQIYLHLGIWIAWIPVLHTTTTTKVARSS